MKIKYLLLLFVCFAFGAVDTPEPALTDGSAIIDVRFTESPVKIIRVKDYNIESLKKLNTYYVQTVGSSRYFMLVNSSVASLATFSYPIKKVVCGAPDLFKIEYQQGEKELLCSPLSSDVDKKNFFTNVTVIFEDDSKLLLVLYGVPDPDEATYLANFRDAKLDKDLLAESDFNLKIKLKDSQSDNLFYSNLLTELANKEFSSFRINKKLTYNNTNYKINSIYDALNYIIFSVSIDGPDEVNKDAVSLLVNNQIALLFFKTNTDTNILSPARIIKSGNGTTNQYLFVFERDKIGTLFHYELELNKNFKISGDAELNSLEDLKNEMF